MMNVNSSSVRIDMWDQTEGPHSGISCLNTAQYETLKEAGCAG